MKQFRMTDGNSDLPTREDLRQLYADTAQQLYKQINDVVRSYESLRDQLCEPWRNFQEGIQKLKNDPAIQTLIHYAALIPEAARQFQKKLEQQELSAIAALGTNGWLGMEHHFGIEEVREMLAAQRERGEDGVNEYIRSHFSEGNYALLTRMVASWERHPYLSPRISIVRDCVDAHIRRAYGLTMPTLLPFAEGMCADAMKAQAAATSRNEVKFAAAQWKELENDKWAELLSEVVQDRVYKSYSFDVDSPLPFNRHGILHGRVHNYATEDNSLRVFLLIDALREVTNRLRVPAIP